MISGSKAPAFDAYGLLRATHSHVSAPLRSVLDMCHWHIAPCPIFAYRGINIPLLWNLPVTALCLQAVHMCKASAFCKHLLRTAFLDNAATIQYDDLICLYNGTHSVGNDHNGLTTDQGR